MPKMPHITEGGKCQSGSLNIGRWGQSFNNNIYNKLKGSDHCEGSPRGHQKVLNSVNYLLLLVFFKAGSFSPAANLALRSLTEAISLSRPPCWISLAKLVL